MRASNLLEKIQKLIDENGDCYIYYYDEDSDYEMSKPEEVILIPLHETKYFCIK